jgi:hypothetical protein
LYEPQTLNEVTGDDFISTKSGIQPTTTTTSTTTTTTTTTTPPTTTARTRLRFPANTTRPRFSLRDHKERLERLSALSRKPAVETKQEEGEASRGRNRSKESVKQQEDEEPSRNTMRQRDSPRGRQRPSTTTSTTTESHVTTESSSTTDRVNHFKPTNSRYRPSKYYGGYRTRTTEAATDAETNVSSTTLRTAVKPKPVFSVTRKPFPLRTRPLRVTTSTTTTELAPLVEDSAVSANEPEAIVTEASTRVTSYEALRATEHEIAPVMSEKADTTTVADAETETSATDLPSPDQDTLSPSQIVADLTSSATSGGYFSKRSNLRITMATEDPILPIEAFFPIRASRDVLS